MKSYYLHPTGNINGLFMDCFGIFLSLTRPTAPEDVSQLPVWAIDNGRFTDTWTEDGWLKFLLRYSPLLDTCLFAVVPDVPFNAEATLEEFERYAPTVRKIGYPLALASQDGMTPSMVPWHEIDALFLGGTDKHKRGLEGGTLIAEAQKHGKWLHVGRVNSGKTLINHFWMANSWDGTTFIRHPKQQYNSVGRAVRMARKMQKARRLI